MNIVELYKEDGYKPRKVSAREYQGPCPGCGGTDRFCLYPGQGGGKAAGMGSFHCGHGKGGNGCGKGGDAITYLQEFRGLSFAEACGVLGLETGRRPASSLIRSPRPRKARVAEAGDTFSPAEPSWPDDVVDPGTWQRHALKFVALCHEQLLGRPKTLEYLDRRGINLDQVRKFMLGIHLGETRNGEYWEPSFRPRKSWGMKDEMKNGRPRMFVLPAGIVIPWFNEHGLRRIRIRLAKPDQRNPKKRYHVVKGSAVDLWLTGADREAFVIVETELDGIMIDRFSDQVGVLALGTVSMKPDAAAAKALAGAHTILNALDYDNAALKASAWWEQHYPTCRRWPVPVGKDPGEMYQEGGKIAAWLSEGLPRMSTYTFSEKTKGRGKNGASWADEVVELLKIMEHGGCSIRVADHGCTVGPVCSEKWALDYPEKRRRLAELIHSTGAAGTLVSGLADGIYSAARLTSMLEMGVAGYEA